MIETSRREFLTGLGAVLIAAPAIVSAGSLMPVKVMPPKLAFPPVYFQERWFWVNSSEPSIIHWSGRINREPVDWWHNAVGA